MKLNNIITLAIIFAALTTSCVQKDNYTPAVAASSASAATSAEKIEKEALTITAGFSSTKAGEDLFKNNWNTSESIAVVSENAESRFLSINSGNVVEFAACSASFDATSVNAVYPYIANINKGASFTFAGQDGSVENLNKFNLMNAAGSVRNGKANLTFNNNIAVIRISNVNLDGCRAENLKSLVLNGVAETVNVKAENGKVNITPAEATAITVKNPALFTSDVYVAFFADNTTTNIEIAVYDAMGGEWFFTLDNGKAFQAGQVYEVENVTFKGGYPVTFNPSVENWN